VPDQSVGPLFPDANRNSITFGASRRISAGELSIFYQAMFFVDRNINVPANDGQYTNGLYHNFADLAGLGLRLYPGRILGKGKH
jgi:hypothetical protein